MPIKVFHYSTKNRNQSSSLVPSRSLKERLVSNVCACAYNFSEFCEFGYTFRLRLFNVTSSSAASFSAYSRRAHLLQSSRPSSSITLSPSILVIYVAHCRRSTPDVNSDVVWG